MSRVRLGGPEDVDAAVSVYECSNLARRGGDWPRRASRVAEVAAKLREPASWFLVDDDGGTTIGMASILPYRADRGAGPVMPGSSFLDLIYVLPDRWGQGIGGAILDAAIEEAARRGQHRIVLWTHEHDNDRAHRLYTGRGFTRTGMTASDDDGRPVAEWLRDV